MMKEARLDDQHVYHEEQYRLFVYAGTLASQPSVQDGWFPFLPTPGKYKHPTYGEVTITHEGNEALVESVRSGVYQEHIPIDAEHQTKLSGAVAWLKDMRLNSDGSADAFFEWTDRGRMLMSGGQFKYVSPEFFGTWPDPATGIVHKNVVAGGAITTRPFFKDKVLRALVASESGTEIIQQESFSDMKKCTDCGEPMPADAEGTICASCGIKAKGKKMSEPPTPITIPIKPEEGKQMNEAEVKAAIDAAVAAARQTFSEETSGQFAELSTRVQAAETLAASEKTAREATQAALDALQADNRQKRFNEMTAHWFGDADKHLNILTKMAEAFGEDSEEVQAYAEQQNTLAASLASTVFKEHGSAASGSSDADTKLENLARKYAEENKVTYEQAYAEVLRSDEGRRVYNEVGQIRH